MPPRAPVPVHRRTATSLEDPRLPPSVPMTLAELTPPGTREPIHWPLERLTEHFGLCPGLEQDACGEWHYEPRWWALCHMWTGDFDVPTARSIIVVEQELPPDNLIDRPSLALDPERVRDFAKWLEQQRDWSSRMASFDLGELSDETRDEIERFYRAPNLWDVRTRGAIDSSWRQLGPAEGSPPPR